MGRAGRADVPRRPVPRITAVTTRAMRGRAWTSGTGILARAQEMLGTRAREKRATTGRRKAPLDSAGGAPLGPVRGAQQVKGRATVMADMCNHLAPSTWRVQTTMETCENPLISLQLRRCASETEGAPAVTPPEGLCSYRQG